MIVSGFDALFALKGRIHEDVVEAPGTMQSRPLIMCIACSRRNNHPRVQILRESIDARHDTSGFSRW